MIVTPLLKDFLSVHENLVLQYIVLLRLVCNASFSDSSVRPSKQTQIALEVREVLE